MNITREEISIIVREELSYVITNVPEVQYELTGVMAQTFAMRVDLQVILEHIDAQGERIEALREDFNRQFADHSQRMDRFATVQEEHSRRMDELREDSNRQFADYSQRMDELREDFNRGFAHLSGNIDRLDKNVAALGARWGTMSESAFREGLIGVLTSETGLRVENYRKMDTRGIVFREPD